MTQIRENLIDNHSKQVAGDLIDTFRNHSIMLMATGCSPAEGMAISTIVARDFAIAALGGAALLSGHDDLGPVFDELLRAMIEEINTRRGAMLATLQEVVRQRT